VRNVDSSQDRPVRRRKLIVVTFAPNDRIKARPPVSIEPAPPKSLSSADKRQRELRAIRAWLKTTWPHLFQKPMPLAIGIGEEIMARASAAGLKRYTVGTALHRWTQSRHYLEALAAPGAVRWGVGGTAVDFVASQHQAGARERLAALAAAKAAKAMAGP
jgi:hypothetical protein